MTCEAASSAAAAAAIRPCAVPVSSALQPRLRDAYFHDSYRFPVGDPQCPALGLYLRSASQTPRWVERLMRLRNRIVVLVGLKNLGGLRGVDPSKPLADYRPGQRVGIFTLISVSDDEVLFGDRDKHLDVVVSVLRLPLDGQGQREAAFSTVVHVHGWLGRLYMLPVVPMHRRIVPAVLRGVLGAPANSPAAFERRTTGLGR